MASSTAKAESQPTDGQAAASAASALHPPKAKASKQQHPLLDQDGKLSSASAATSLKYAKPRDLPSYPSAGLKFSSAGAAASLASSNQKAFEHWKPGAFPAAQKAAALAKDYEADAPWRPELSAAGSKAAVLAAKDGSTVEVWRPGEQEGGRSAAGQALKSTKSPAYDRAIPAEVSRKALIAATGAMAGSRRRAESAPLKPQAADAGYALRAAASIHKVKSKESKDKAAFGVGDPAFEASRIQNMAQTKESRQMYTSNPPVAIEVEEKKRKETLKASSVAMAQKIYSDHQSSVDEEKSLRRNDSQSAAIKVHSHSRGLSETSSVVEPMAYNPYGNLEEAARKLAQERLDKLRDEHQEYRDYYGQSSPARASRLSVRRRQRASSDGRIEETDEEQSRKIRSQMSIFQSKVAEVDNKKRQIDRDALMATAQKNVAAKMALMDDTVFQQTGKSSPAQREQWEIKAREKAQANSDGRMENFGKVHIGGGKYIDQADVDAVARARIQPTLDDITEKAEQQRARDEEMKAEQQRQADIKAEAKRARDIEKQEEKDRKAEAKRIQKEAAAAQKEKDRAEKEAADAIEREKAAIEKEEQRRFITRQSEYLSATTSRADTEGTATPRGAEDSDEEVGPDSKKAAEATKSEDEEGKEEGLTSVYQQITHLRRDSESELAETGEAADGDAEGPSTEPVETKSPPEQPSQLISDAAKKIEEEQNEASAKANGEPIASPTSPKAENEMGSPPSSPPAKGDSKVKTWFKGRFRRLSMTKNAKENDKENDKEIEENGFTKTSLVNGPSLKELNFSDSSFYGLDEAPRDDSVREVAMVGRISTPETDDLYGAPASLSVSPISSDDEGDKTETRGRRGFQDKSVEKVVSKESNKNADGEEESEADKMEEKSTAPAKTSSPTDEGAPSSKPAQTEATSKFTEVL